MAACSLAKVVVFLTICMPACGHDPAADQPDLLRKIDDLELKLRDLRGQVQAQAVSLGANATSLGKGADAASPAPAKSIDRLQAFTRRWREWSNAHMSRVLLSDPVFWLSILAILQWHIRFHLGEIIWRCIWLKCHPRYLPQRRHKVKPFLLPRKLGMNVLILVTYYDTDLPIPTCLYEHVRGRVFLTTIFLILLDSLVLYYGFMLLGSLVDPHSVRCIDDWQNPVDLKEEDGITPRKYKATNIYEDLTRPFRRVFPMFLAQLALVSLYMEELNVDPRTHDIEYVNFNYWVAAVIFQIYAGDAQVGEPFNWRYWKLILRSKSQEEKVNQCARGLCKYARKLLGQRKEPDFPEVGGGGFLRLKDSREECVPKRNVEEEGRRRKQREKKKHLTDSFADVGACWHLIFFCIPLKFLHEWHARRVMDVVINSLSRSIILYTVPIMVSVEEPLDFVKDLTAVMFITVLDDAEEKDLKEILVKLKFGLFYGRDRDEDVPGAVELKDEEREDIAENWEQYRDISLTAPDEWDDFLEARGRPQEAAEEPAGYPQQGRSELLSAGDF